MLVLESVGSGPQGHGTVRSCGECWPQCCSLHHMAPVQIFYVPRVCGVGVLSFMSSLIARGASLCLLQQQTLSMLAVVGTCL